MRSADVRRNERRLGRLLAVIRTCRDPVQLHLFRSYRRINVINKFPLKLHDCIRCRLFLSNERSSRFALLFLSKNHLGLL